MNTDETFPVKIVLHGVQHTATLISWDADRCNALIRFDNGTEMFFHRTRFTYTD